MSQIIEVCKNSRTILLTDTVAAGSLGILKMLLCSSSREKIHVLLFEHQKGDFLAGLPENVQSRIVVHDFVTDPLGWLGEKDRCIQCDLLQYTNDFCTSQSKEGVVLVLDSLSNLIQLRSLSYTCQVIHALMQRGNAAGESETQVIAGLHRDLHDPSLLSQLEHISSAVLTISPPVHSDFTVSCSVLNKKVTGKVIKTREEYRIGDMFQLLEYQEINAAVNVPTEDTKVDPTANLTFNLSLRDSEKEARNQTQLPYVYDKLRQNQVLQKSVGEGKIFYQPDEADDFDEDDPDDDLEI